MGKRLCIIFIAILSVFSGLIFVSPAYSQNHLSLADVNGDGEVNVIDTGIILDNYLRNPLLNPKADVNKDGEANIIDVGIVLDNYGAINPATPNTATPVTTPVTTTNPTKVQVGVRWYASLHSKANNGNDRRSVHEQWLADQKWRTVWPYYTIIRSDTAQNTTVDIHQDNQKIIDQEIQLAAAAGLDYFVFESGTIDPKFPLSLYLLSPNKNLMKFALLNPMADLVEPDKWNRHLDALSALVKDPQYVEVNSGQSLIFFEQIDSFVSRLGADQTRIRLAELRQRVKNATGRTPYLVLYNWASGNTFSQPQNFGIDARILYNCRLGETVSGAPYSQLAQGCERRWTNMVMPGADFIPTAQVAYDPRSRREAKSGEDADNSVWYQKGTPSEIASHVKNAVNWVKSHPVEVPANTVVIAAWSDYSEGGWLEPTLSEGNARLNAIAKVLGGRQTASPRSPYADSPPPPHTIGQVTNLSAADNQIFKANSPIIISGQAPAAVRLNFRLGQSRLEYINGDSNNFYKPDRLDFTVQLPPLPPGGPYNLSISSPDIKTVIIQNLKIQ